MSAKILLALVMVMAFPGSAAALDLEVPWRPFSTPVEQVHRDIREARQRGKLDLCNSLLEQAEAVHGGNQPLFLHERGLLLRERGRLPESAEVLRRAADLDPESEARVDLAGVLVTLGRWPEAVEVLKRAFEERGAQLRADGLLVDPRFAALCGFAPYDELMRTMRAEQSGPLGRLVLKFERIDNSVHSSETVLLTLAGWMSALGRLFDFVLTPLLLLLALGLFITFGINQLGLLSPPWPLFIGMGLAAGLWHLGSEVVSGGDEAGLAVILPALLAVVAPWLAHRLLTATRRRARGQTLTKLTESGQIAGTAALLERCAEAARHLNVCDESERARAQEELCSLLSSLRDTLGRESASCETQRKRGAA